MKTEELTMGLLKHYGSVQADAARGLTGAGPFGNMEMGGMFTVVKVRDDLKSYYEDPGWYRHPEGTVAWPVK